jgi:hypothetical protein
VFWDLVQKMIPGLSGVDRLAAVFTAAFGALSDGKMWRSLGWIVLGLVLMIVAIIWLMGGVLGKTVPDAGTLGSAAALAA